MTAPLIPLKQDPAWDDLPIPSFLRATGTRAERREQWDTQMAEHKAHAPVAAPLSANEHSADLRAQADAAAKERNRIKTAAKREQASGVAADKAAVAAGKTWDTTKGQWV